MSKFARLFDLPEVDNQLLITVDYDTDDELYWLRARTDFDGMSISVAISTRTNSRLLKRMAEYTHEDALAQYQGMEKIIADGPVGKTIKTGVKKREKKS